MKKILSVLFVSVLWCGVQAQQMIYVSPGGMGDGTVSNPIDLQGALNLAVSNGEDDVLYLAAGSYSNTPYTIDYGPGDGQQIAIWGSWNSDYSAQSFDPISTTISGNSANQCFSVDAMDAGVSGVLEMKYLNFNSGLSTEAHGAGILVQTGNPTESNIHLDLEHVVFLNCNANNQKSGGAIFTTSTFEIESCTFSGCSAYNGGAIFAGISSFMPDASRTIRNTVFEANSNYGNQGSTIWTNCPDILVEDSEFYGMEGDGLSGNGGCVNVDAGGFATFDRCVFEGIHINYWGSAIHSWNSSIAVYNSLFHNNKSGELTGFGTIAYYHNNDLTNRTHEVVNCTFANNTTGNGFYADIHYRGIGGDQLNVSNSIFWGNNQTSVYKESGTATISHSIGQTALLNFTQLTPTSTEDPMLTVDFGIGEGSPALDAGSNDFVLPDWLDLNGGKRLLGSSVDIGCEEYNAPPQGVELSTLTIEENNESNFAFSIASATGQEGDEHSYETVLGDGGVGVDFDQFYFLDEVLYIIPGANFEQQSSYAIAVQVTDSEGQFITVDFEIAVNDLNEPPVFVTELAPQTGVVGEPNEFAIDEEVVFDEDIDDELTFSADLADGGVLPDWLNFDAETITFSGTPEEATIYEIRLTATDMGGLSADSTFIYSILSVGIAENGLASLDVFPNPARETIRIITDCSGRQPYVIKDVLGKTVLEGWVSCTDPVVSVNAISSGVYLLLLNDSATPGIARFEKH